MQLGLWSLQQLLVAAGACLARSPKETSSEAILSFLADLCSLWNLGSSIRIESRSTAVKVAKILTWSRFLVGAEGSFRASFCLSVPTALVCVLGRPGTTVFLTVPACSGMWDLNSPD